jgi:hypothetical protein
MSWLESLFFLGIIRHHEIVIEVPLFRGSLPGVFFLVVVRLLLEGNDFS